MPIASALTFHYRFGLCFFLIYSNITYTHKSYRYDIVKIPLEGLAMT